ncbi:hypothetical protein ABZP36_013457 [Zizania latifolia]
MRRPSGGVSTAEIRERDPPACGGSAAFPKGRPQKSGSTGSATRRSDTSTGGAGDGGRRAVEAGTDQRRRRWWLAGGVAGDRGGWGASSSTPRVECSTVLWAEPKHPYMKRNLLTKDHSTQLSFHSILFSVFLPRKRRGASKPSALRHPRNPRFPGFKEFVLRDWRAAPKTLLLPINSTLGSAVHSWIGLIREYLVSQRVIPAPIPSRDVPDRVLC